MRQRSLTDLNYLSKLFTLACHGTNPTVLLLLELINAFPPSSDIRLGIYVQALLKYAKAPAQ